MDKTRKIKIHVTESDIRNGKDAYGQDPICLALRRDYPGCNPHIDSVTGEPHELGVVMNIAGRWADVQFDDALNNWQKKYDKGETVTPLFHEETYYDEQLFQWYEHNDEKQDHKGEYDEIPIPGCVDWTL